MPIPKRSLLSVVILVGGCVGSAEFANEPYDDVRADPRPFQEVFASTTSIMRACGFVTSTLDFAGTATNQVERDLYPDLGYGEITTYITGGLGSMPQLSIRIEAADQGSVVSIRAANMISSAEARTIATWRAWTSGVQDC